MSNEELVMKAKQSDVEARNQLWEQNQGLLNKLLCRYFGVCRRYGLTSDDLLQEGFMVILWAIDQYDPGKDLRFSSYLNFGVKHVLRKLFGSRALNSDREDHQRFKEISLHSCPFGEEGELGDTIPDPAAEQELQAVEDSVYTKQLRRDLDACMERQLDALQAEVVQRVYYQAQPCKVVGAEIGYPVKYVHTLKRKALQRMRGDPRIRSYRDDVACCMAYQSGLGRFKREQSSSVESAVEWIERIENLMAENGRLPDDFDWSFSELQ